MMVFTVCVQDGEVVETAREDPRSHRILLPDSGLFFLRAQQVLRWSVMYCHCSVVMQGRAGRDSGQYWCTASNSQGSVNSSRATLTIACKLIFAMKFLQISTDNTSILSSLVSSSSLPTN